MQIEIYSLTLLSHSWMDQIIYPSLSKCTYLSTLNYPMSWVIWGVQNLSFLQWTICLLWIIQCFELSEVYKTYHFYIGQFVYFELSNVLSYLRCAKLIISTMDNLSTLNYPMFCVIWGVQTYHLFCQYKQGRILASTKSD